mmetsp:Transcript_10979/g.32620  ORF Transcript_10979/g.32620 Transcript_10979/m.32620 type:complete len:205 (+) Transcript_10979:386-1000(+)
MVAHVVVHAVGEAELDGARAPVHRAVEERRAAIGARLVVTRGSVVGCRLVVLQPRATGGLDLGLEVGVQLLEQHLLLPDLDRVSCAERAVPRLGGACGERAVLHAPLAEQLDQPDRRRDDADRADDARGEDKDLVARGGDVVPARRTNIGCVAEQLDVRVLLAQLLQPRVQQRGLRRRAAGRVELQDNAPRLHLEGLLQNWLER